MVAYLQTYNLGPEDAEREPVFDTNSRRLGALAHLGVALLAQKWHASRSNEQLS